MHLKMQLNNRKQNLQNFVLIFQSTIELPIEKDASGKPEIHHTRIFRIFQRWVKDGCFEKIFVGSVGELFTKNLLDVSVIHGDGTTTSAKKGAII